MQTGWCSGDQLSDEAPGGKEHLASGSVTAWGFHPVHPSSEALSLPFPLQSVPQGVGGCTLDRKSPPSRFPV